MPSRDEIDAYLGEVLSQHPSVPRDVARKLIGVESSWNQDAVSPKGARGLGQLMPATAKELGVDPNDWRQNVEGSVRYLAQNIDRFGSVELGVGAYHAGPGNVRKAGNKVPDTHDGIMSTKDYVRKITGGSGEDAGGGEFTQAADRAPTRRVGKKDRAVLPEWEDAQAFDPVTATGTAPQEEMGSFHRGFAVTWPQTQQLAGGAVAGLADLVGLDSMKQWGLNYYKSKEDEVKALSRETDSFSHVYENGGWAEWLKYGAGYVTGQALESIAAALAGAAVGSMAAPGPGTAAGTFVGFFAKQAVKDGLKTQVEKVMAETVAAQMARGVAADVAQEAALAAGKTVTQGFLRNQAAKVGGATALGAFNFTQEYGGIFPELVEQLGKMGVEMTGEDRARALGAGVLAAGVESASDLIGMGKVLKGAGGSTMVRRLAREVPEGMAREGLTEGTQTAIERFGAQKELTGDEATRDYVDSTALGVFGGGLAGGAASVRGRPAPEATDTVPPLPTPGATPNPAAGTAPGAAPAGPDGPTQPPGDVGRPSDGKPFASSANAHRALRTRDLMGTHEVQQVGDNAFVLRPLPDASESPESAATLNLIHQQGRDDIAAQRDFTPEPEATQPRGENMAGPDAVSDEEVQQRMAAAAKMQEGDVGKPKNGAPFTHRIAAVGAAKRLGLSDTHDVVELGKAQFVLRAKQEAEPDATLPKTESVNQTSLQSGESVNQPAAEVPADASTTPVPGAQEKDPEQTPTGEQSGTPAVDEPARSYASTQVALPKGVAADVIKAGQALIKPEDVHPEKGMEKRPHVTVKYGLHDNAPEAVGKLIADEPPVKAKITGLDVFSPEGKDYDVIVARVDSPDLHRLNAKIKALPNTEDFPDYKPHITLGYVKRGAGAKYAKAKTTLVGREFEVRNLEFSDQNEKITKFPLRGTAAVEPKVPIPPAPPTAEQVERAKAYDKQRAEELRQIAAAPKDAKGRGTNEHGVYEPTETIALASKTRNSQDAEIDLTELADGRWIYGKNVHFNYGDMRDGGFAPSYTGPFFAARGEAILDAATRIVKEADAYAKQNAMPPAQAQANRTRGWAQKLIDDNTAETAPPDAPPKATPETPKPKLGKADLEGLTVKFPVQVAETGETVFVEQDAKEALVEARSRKRILQQLLKCVSA